MEKLIITAAISGAEVTKENNPAVPYTVEEFVEEVRKCKNAGASIIHLHARYDDGTATQDINRYNEIITAIKKEVPDVIIQVSTGGAVGMSIEERIDVLNLNPRMATLDCGTLNFGGDDIFINTENDIKKVFKVMKAQGVKPELECFEKGHIDSVLRLAKKGHLGGPFHFSFVLGVNGGMSGDMRDFVFLKESIPSDSTFSVAGIGRYEFSLATLSILSGGHVRVGLEDNIYISKGVKAKSNAELVEKIVNIANLLGREIASYEDTLKILEIRGE